MWLLFSPARDVIQKSEWLIVAVVREPNNTRTDRWPGPALTDYIQRNWEKKINIKRKLFNQVVI